MQTQTKILLWAVEHIQKLSKLYLRLCDDSHPRLKAVYQGFGFCDRSQRQVDAYFVFGYEYQIPPPVI
ncbi:MAG: hypothetical protein V7K89_33710 [Nostoc sp.]|uniref:hypothetical protein n=1 Tax=Nostoc sp. TaxID=1180 RepID=UPI002FF7A4E9